MTMKSSSEKTPQPITVFETEYFRVTVGAPPIQGDCNTPQLVYNIINRNTGVVEEFSTAVAHAIEWATHMSERLDALLALPEVEEAKTASH